MNKGQFKVKHGLSRHPAYRTWSGMVSRCHDSRNHHFGDYGARGIYVCDAWRHHPAGFIEWAMANGFGDGRHIDRKDNDGPYSPENCWFVPPVVNANNKRNNTTITVHGESLTLAEAARKYGLAYQTVTARLRKGWTGDRLVAPARPKRRAAQ